MGGRMEIAERIARGLQAASAYAGLTCYMVSKRAKINSKIVTRYFMGLQKSIDRATLSAICNALNADVDEIIAGTCKYGLYMGDLENYGETICWTCKRAAAPREVACAWSGLDSKGNPMLQPVKGWNAIKTELEIYHNAKGSYLVIGCPEYIRDKGGQNED